MDSEGHWAPGRMWCCSVSRDRKISKAAGTLITAKSSEAQGLGQGCRPESASQIARAGKIRAPWHTARSGPAWLQAEQASPSLRCFPPSARPMTLDLPTRTGES